jgi:hypothetical protein
MQAQPNVWIVPAIVILLSAYALAAILALASPSSDPQRGMAQGFLMMIVMFLLLLGGLLWLGTHPYRPFLVWTLFIVAAYPAVMLGAKRIYLLIRAIRSD